MVASVGAGEGEDRGREEHSLVIRVRNEQTDALVLESWEARLDDVCGVDVQGRQHEHQSREAEQAELHGWA